MTDKKTMKLALKALEEWYFGCGAGSESHDDAVEAIKQALANDALDKMAENARELGLDYEPHKGLSEHLAQVTNGRVRIDPVTGNVGIGTPPAAQRPWLDLTDEQIKAIDEMALTKNMAIAMTMATLKEVNT
jgi:hypothetical protein